MAALREVLLYIELQSWLVSSIPCKVGRLDVTILERTLVLGIDILSNFEQENV